jgi:organic radical activating enzyme
MWMWRYAEDSISFTCWQGWMASVALPPTPLPLYKAAKAETPIYMLLQKMLIEQISQRPCFELYWRLILQTHKRSGA